MEQVVKMKKEQKCIHAIGPGCRHFVLICLLAVLCLTGCRAIDGGVTYSPTLVEREGLALSRIVCSPVNMCGFFCAEVKDCYPHSTYLFPFMLCYTIPAGALATVGDIVTGTMEMLSGQQCTQVCYPWESFDLESSAEWRKNSREIFVVAMAAACEAAAEEAANQTTEYLTNGHSSGGGSSYDSSSGSGPTGGVVIVGPLVVYRGKKYYYDLTIGGKKVTRDTSWSCDLGATMYGNCLEVSSKRGTGYCKIRAEYNGKMYTKLLHVK